MLPKSGDAHEPGNWRPIAILQILYKVFSRMRYNRLAPVLNAAQLPDQVGFRPSLCVDDVFVMLESVCSTCNEWQLPRRLRQRFLKADVGATLGPGLAAKDCAAYTDQISNDAPD